MKRKSSFFHAVREREMENRELEKRIGYQFKDRSLLETALTHPSRSNEDRSLEDNQRLEFLGDAVIDLIIGEHLYRKFPDEKEGILTKQRALIVCADSFFLASKKFELGEFLKLGKGEIMNGGKYKKNIIADGFEALIGAVFMDSDYETTKKTVLTLLDGIIRKAETGNLTYDYKSLLQEHVHQKKIKDFSYNLVRITGPEHNQVFTSELLIEGKAYGTGTGKNKKESEQHAALEALKKMGAV